MESYNDNYPNPEAGDEPQNTQAQNQENPQAQDNPEPNPQEVPADSLYRNSGAGRKESPYADSPYYSYQETHQDPPSGGAQEPWEQEKPKKQKKHRTCGAGKHILAAVLTVVLVAGSCGITGAVVNSHWQKKQDEMTRQFNAKIDALEQDVNRMGAVVGSSSVSGSPVAMEGALTPSQVYARNVNSVVAIANQSHTNVFGQTTEMASSGTGFILTSDGYIISNYHVVENADTLTVMTYMGDEYQAKLVGFDQINDVSLLKVDATNLAPVTIGSSDALIVGDQVVAIGNPLGELTSSLTVGYISAKDRTINTDGSLINMMQTDAAINPGNSGGPLFNMKGEVVGITTAKFSGNTSSGASIEGIGFAIPIDDVMGMINDLKDFGYLKNQAYLGVVVENMDPKTAQYYSLPTGAYVRSVSEGSCAEKAGILPRDIITGVGGYEVTGNASLITGLRKFSAGDTTTVTVFRAGQVLELEITLDERPEEPVVPEPTVEPTQAPQEMPQGMDPFEFFRRFFG